MGDWSNDVHIVDGACGNAIHHTCTDVIVLREMSVCLHLNELALRFPCHVSVAARCVFLSVYHGACDVDV